MENNQKKIKVQALFLTIALLLILSGWKKLKAG